MRFALSIHHPSFHAPTFASAGMTLVEVLISVAILAMGTTYVTQALVRGAHGLHVASTRSSVYTFAVSKLADVELSARDGDVPKPSGQFRDGRTQFLWTVEALPLPEQPLLEVVTLTITWSQGRQRYSERFHTVRRSLVLPEAS